jgi:hypothetical protein
MKNGIILLSKRIFAEIQTILLSRVRLVSSYGIAAEVIAEVIVRRA